MEGIIDRCEVLVREIIAWKLAAGRWRRFARRLMQSERIRFRGIVGESVWERDMILAPTQKWKRMLLDDELLGAWSTFQHGPLMIALSPPPVIILDSGESD